MRPVSLRGDHGSMAFMRLRVTCRFRGRCPMATGWAGDNAVNEQIDATVKDGIQRV